MNVPEDAVFDADEVWERSQVAALTVLRDAGATRDDLVAYATGSGLTPGEAERLVDGMPGGVS